MMVIASLAPLDLGVGPQVLPPPALLTLPSLLPYHPTHQAALQGPNPTVTPGDAEGRLAVPGPRASLTPTPESVRRREFS